MISAKAFPLCADVPFADHDIDTGIEPVGMGKHFSRESGPHAPLRDVDSAGSRFSFICEPGVPNCLADLCDYRPGRVEADFTCGRQCHSAPPPGEYGGSDFLLKASDLAGEGGLREVQALCSANECCFLANRDERFQLPQIHRLFGSGMRTVQNWHLCGR